MSDKKSLAQAWRELSLGCKAAVIIGGAVCVVVAAVVSYYAFVVILAFALAKK